MITRTYLWSAERPYFLITGKVKKPQSFNRWLITAHNHLMWCKVITARLGSLKMVSVYTKTHWSRDYMRVVIQSEMHKTWLINGDTGKKYSSSSNSTPSVQKTSQLFFQWNSFKKMDKCWSILIRSKYTENRMVSTRPFKRLHRNELRG